MSGGVKLKRKLTASLKTIGFAVPIFIIVSGAVGQFFNGNIENGEAFKFVILSFAWLILASSQLLGNKYSKAVLILYHLLATLSILTMYDVMAPFIPFWILLALTSYIRYRKIGLFLSLSWLVVTLIMNAALMIYIQPNILIYELSSLIAVFTASYVIVMLSQSQEKALIALHNSKTRESLQRNRLLSIINNQSDGIISVDKGGYIRVFNAAGMWLLDTNQDLLGKKINQVLPLYDLDQNPIDTFKTLKSYHVNTTRSDILFKSPEGEMLRLEVTFTPIKRAYGGRNTPEGDGYVLIFRDITKEKSLDDERDEFISVVSHELRTPVTVAEGALSNAQLLYSNPRAPKVTVRKSLRIAHDQVLFLAGLINDLSTLSRAQRNLMAEPELISVKELGHQTINRYCAEAKKNGLRLNLDMSPHLGSVFTSRLYLEELIQNLVQNAIKYTPTGNVTLHLTRKGDTIKFAVQDSGVGISRSERKKIFQKFYRSEDYRTRETNGTGLGLYLSTQLADKMGTCINLTSRIDHGSTFYFELPAKHESND